MEAKTVFLHEIPYHLHAWLPILCIVSETSSERRVRESYVPAKSCVPQAVYLVEMPFFSQRVKRGTRATRAKK